LSQHDRGVALLPREQAWLQIGAEGGFRSGVESGLAVGAAQPTTPQQRIENDPTSVRVLSSIVGDDRTKIRIGEASDLCLVQLCVRSGSVGNRQVVVLGGR